MVRTQLAPFSKKRIQPPPQGQDLLMGQINYQWNKTTLRQCACGSGQEKKARGFRRPKKDVEERHEERPRRSVALQMLEQGFLSSGGTRSVASKMIFQQPLKAGPDRPEH